MIHFNEEFFVAVVTVLFFALTFKPMKRALLSMLDLRIEGIRKNLAEAERLKNEAAKLLKEAEDKLARSEKDAELILDHARKEAEQLIENTRAKLNEDIEVRKKMAVQKIQAYEDKAINDLKSNVSAITVEIATKAMGDNNNDDNMKKLVSSSIEKLSKTIH